MKFGMPTLVECKDLEDCAKIAASHGLDFIEINFSFPQYQPINLTAYEAKRISKEYGIGYTIHADEMLNPFDFNPLVREAYWNVMKETISFAKELSIPIINMHLQRGVYVTLPDKVILLTDVYYSIYESIVKSFIEMCENEIAESKVKIAIENIDNNIFTKSQLDKQFITNLCEEKRKYLK